MHDKPWWLEAGTARCEFCVAAYHEEIAVHCAHCDRAVCPTCAVEVYTTREWFCPECAP
jgi:hypothetical protein